MRRGLGTATVVVVMAVGGVAALLTPAGTAASPSSIWAPPSPIPIDPRVTGPIPVVTPKPSVGRATLVAQTTLQAAPERGAVRKEQATFQLPGLGGPSPGGLPSPRQQNAASKEFIEGHWLGLESIPLTPELATEYRIPKGEHGVLVDEVTLEAAESGILAGDMVHAIEGYPTPNLKEFFVATQRVRNQRTAKVEVGRRGQTMTFVMEARNAPELGFSQMEAAQPIQPGALSPHRMRSKPCTSCHVIMTSGGQLPTDAGDILPNPPPISLGATPPHPYRGACNNCHQIIK